MVLGVFGWWEVEGLGEAWLLGCRWSGRGVLWMLGLVVHDWIVFRVLI